MPKYETTPMRVKIGADLKALRLKCGLKLVDVSAITGKPIATLSLIEQGKQNITLQMLEDIVAAYDKDLLITFKKPVYDIE